MSLNDFFEKTVDEEFNERVCIIGSDRSLSMAGGIGNFIKGLINILPKTCLIDIRLLTRVSKIEFPSFQNVIVTRYSGQIPNLPSLPFSAQGIRYADVVNFYPIILEILNSVSFDSLMCTCPESVLAASLAVEGCKNLNILYVTHNPTISTKTKIFSNDYIEMCNRYIPKLEAIKIITQTPRNAAIIGEDLCQVIPLPLSDLELLEDTQQEKDGVLFIGNCNAQKGAEEYVKVVKQSGMRAKVLSGGIGSQEKWKELFQKYGVTDYEVRKLFGKEKVDFIKSSKISYLPHVDETYCLGVFEAMTTGPVILNPAYPWTSFWMQFKSIKTGDPLTEILNYKVSNNEGLLEARRLQTIAKEAWLKALLSGKIDVQKYPSWINETDGLSLKQILEYRKVKTFLPGELVKLRSRASKIIHNKDSSLIYL
jgi:hypothetical protein